MADASGDRADRLHRATIEFGLDASQAEQFEAVVALVDPDRTGAPASQDVTAFVDGLDDPRVAEAAWIRWGDDDLLGGPVADVLQMISEGAAIDVADRGGLAWLTARDHQHHGRLEDASATLDASRASGHPLVLVELAGYAADRSDPLAARELLVAAGVDVDVDLDAEFDPRDAALSYGVELAEEIAPFAAVRPRPMAGRNDRCPCGSGRKYKQCHLGNELHPIEDRAGWLYVKLMRFLQTHEPNLAAVVAADLVEHVAADDIRAMVHESYLPVDLALFEGGVAQRFLDTKRSVLPPDEVALLESWLGAHRSAFEVDRSRPGAMDLIDLADRTRATVVDTVPDEPLEPGWKVIGRLTQVGETFRSYGGFLPVNDDMVDAMIAGFAPRSLEAAVLTIGQIFDVAATQDEIAALFEEGLDTSELQGLLDELGDAGHSDD